VSEETEEVEMPEEGEELSSEPKDIDDYEYTVKVHDATDTEVTLLLEEVDGNDGFAITLQLAEIEPVLSDPQALHDKLEPYVEQRIELLKSVKQEEDSRKVAKEKVESKLKQAGEVKVGKVKKKR